MAEITSAKAMARTVRVSPRKSRLVLDNIRGKNVADAIAILKFTPNKAAGIIEKVLNSAIANAENNFGLEKANLVVASSVIGMPNGMLKKNTRITFMKILQSVNSFKKNWLTQRFQLLKLNAQ